MEKLSALESKRYAVCKKQISDGLQTCFDTGLALTEIRDSKLYREDFDTFAEFCQQTYQLGKTHAYRLIESAEIKMSPIGDKITNEAQARAIALVPEIDRPKVLKLAEKAGDVTAAAISQAAEKVEASKPTPKPSPKPAQDAIVLDRTGLPIPHQCMEVWNRTPEVQKFLTWISDMRSTLKHAQDEKDLLWGGLSYSGAIAELNKAYCSIECAKPYAVCPKCQGRLAKNCTCCNGRGMISQYKWDTTITREEKAMRVKVVEKLRASA